MSEKTETDDTENEVIEGNLGTCDRCYRASAEIPVVTVVNGYEQKEWVCEGCEKDAREDEKLPADRCTDADTDGGKSSDE